MAVILQVTYQKKLGLPQFSSHSCSVSITTEIQDKSQAAEESSKLYQLLQSAVDQNIQTVGFMPEATYGMKENGNGNGSNGHHQQQPKQSLDRWNMTEGQRGFLLRIVNENSISKEDVEDLSQQLFGLGVKALNKMQASQLIEDLLVKAGKPARQNRWRKPQPQSANGA